MAQDQTLFLTQVAFVVVIAIPSVITIGVLVYIAWRFIPIMIRQMQHLIDNNSKLTEIAKQNADQIKATEDVLASIKPELVRQTNAIEAQTIEIKTQSIDFRSYQTLISDGLSNHSAQIESNTARVSSLELAMAALPAQILEAIRDELACTKILAEFQALRNEVTRAVFQQTKVTGTFPVVPNTTSFEPPSKP